MTLRASPESPPPYVVPLSAFGCGVNTCRESAATGASECVGWGSHKDPNSNMVEDDCGLEANLSQVRGNAVTAC